MALTLAGSGTQTATVSTEHTLSTLTTGHTFVLVVDTATLVAGDELELRLYTKVLTAGTERQAYVVSYIGVQTSPAKYSIPIPANISLRATLKQVAGTSRAFPWAILSLD